MIEIIIAVVGILIGGGIAFFVVNSKNNDKAKLIIVEAQKNAEQIKKEKILQAKEKFIELKGGNRDFIQEDLDKIKFTSIDCAHIVEHTQMLSSPKNKYENKFRYNLYNKMDFVYCGMGHSGFYLGNYYIKKV